MSAYRHASRAIIRSEGRSLGHNAMIVLAVMATWADPKSAEPVCFKEQESIARRAKLSVSSVGRALTELERAGAIKRLGIVGGHALKRCTIKWGLILLWGDDLGQAPLSVTVTDKEGTSVTVTDKEPVTVTDKEPVTVTDNSSQSHQSDPKGASDDEDDSGALAPGPARFAADPGSAPSKSAASPVPMLVMVMEETGWTIAAAESWIATKLSGRNVRDPDRYLRACLAARNAAPAESASTARSRPGKSKGQKQVKGKGKAVGPRATYKTPEQDQAAAVQRVRDGELVASVAEDMRVSVGTVNRWKGAVDHRKREAERLAISRVLDRGEPLERVASDLGMPGAELAGKVAEFKAQRARWDEYRTGKRSTPYE